MGAFTIEKTNNLYWLGRYIERVYQTINAYERLFDQMIDENPEIYHDFCRQLDIQDFYLNDAHFMTSYLYDRSNPDSIISNLLHAYNDAIVLREDISSATLSYIQMACNIFEEMEYSDAPVLLLQKVKDNILAFWGSVDETVDEVGKNVIKCGKYVERIDMYLRLDYKKHDLDKGISKLNNRVVHLEEVFKIKDINEYKIDETGNHFMIQEKLNELNTLFMV